jgi:hypothetical protein
MSLNIVSHVADGTHSDVEAATPREDVMLAMTKDEAEAYARDGYIIRKGLLSTDEVDVFRNRARAQLEAENKSGSVMTKGDKDGKATLLKMWTKA